MMIQTGMVINNRYEIISKYTYIDTPNLYMAKDVLTKQPVTIKLWIDDKGAEGDLRLFNFKSLQARSLTALRNSNVMEVYEVGRNDQLYYQVMECVEGISLKKYITKKGKLSYKEALSILIQISYGVDAAHKNGLGDSNVSGDPILRVVHGDLRPGNVMISTIGKIKVANFGMASLRYLTWNLSPELTREVTPDARYMAPELLDYPEPSIQSDIYSIGMTLIEMLMGHIPFENESDAILLAELHRNESFLPLNLPVSEQSQAIEKIVRKCCSASENARYSNVYELINDAKEAILLPDTPLPEADTVYVEHNEKTGKTVYIKTNDMLVEILKRFEEFATDRRLFKAYLRDCIPNEKQLQNNLMGSLEEQIPQDIHKLTYVSSRDFGRFAIRYSDAYGISVERAEVIVATWIHALEIETEIQMIVK